jgi:hypothetical protein
MTIHYESFSLQVGDFSVLVQGTNLTANEINPLVREGSSALYYWLI